MHRSFSLGFPNLFDGLIGGTALPHGRGRCSSMARLFAVTRPEVDEIWRLVTTSARVSRASRCTPSPSA